MTGARSAPASSPAEVAALLRSVRRRWTAARLLRGLARAASAAALALAAVLAADLLLAPSDLVMAVVAGVLAAASAVFTAWTLWPLRRRPSDRQVARYVEERCPRLQDRLASAVGLRPAPSSFGGRVLDEAARRARGVDPRRVVSARTLRRAAVGGVGAAAASAVLALAGADALGRIARGAWLYAAPFGAALVVEPGEARLTAGEPLEVRARLDDTLGALGRSVPRVTVTGPGGGRASFAMSPRGAGFAATLPPAPRSFTYRVHAAAHESDDFAVTVLHPPRVERIDVAYAYPAYTGLEPRVETGGGDVFAPEGTRVTLTVHADKPIREGALRRAADGAVALRGGAPGALSASFEVTRDDTYRVSVRDADGLSNRSDAVYVIRAAADEAPFVEVLRPGGDREVTPLEEVVIEARAEDDFALDRFELVYAVAGRSERVVDLLGGEPLARRDGAHTLYAEDLGVAPGDLVSYHVRAGDARPGRARLTRGDVHFLEVRPFEREFEDAPSPASLSMDAGAVGQLAAVQKEIVAATWRLDGRPAPAADDADLAAVAAAQAELRQAVLAAAVRAVQREGGREEWAALAAAADAMARAETALRAASTGEALPAEMDALAALLRARAAIRRTRLTRGGSGQSAGWQAQEDLSRLFDRDLRREQETNYENRPSTPSAESGVESEALRRVRELAERRQALERAREDLERRRGALDEDEAARVLERLTREEEELRAGAEALERALDARAAAGRPDRGAASEPSAAPGSPTSAGAAGAAAAGSSASPEAGGRSASAASADANGRAGRGIDETARRALAELRRGDAAGAAERAREALDRLRGPGRSGAAAGETAAADEARRLAAELSAAEALRRSLQALEERLGRVGTRAGRPGETGPDDGRPGGSGAADSEREAVGAAARELLRRLESLPDLRETLRAARPGVLEDLARRAAGPAGGGGALRGREQDFAAWESLRDGLRQAIEAFEADRARALQAATTGGRLDVGAGEAVPDGYGPLVERYYRSLADRRPRPERR